MNRSAFLRLGVLAGAGLAAVAAGASPRRMFAAAADRSAIRFDFRSARDRAHWGSRWLPVHYRRRMDVRRGAAQLVLPRGLPTTASAQPVPVFLRDCDDRRGTQLMTFTLSNATLRPGLLFEGRPPFTFHAVTLEEGRLVLARYFRSDRAVLARSRERNLRKGAVYSLKVARTRERVLAKIWVGPREPEWQLDVRLDTPRPGCFGVVTVVIRSNKRPATLRIREYRLTVADSFSNTKPSVPFAIAGAARENPDGSRVVRLRAANSLPGTIQFEWSFESPSGPLQRTPQLNAGEPPYTAVTQITVPSGKDLDCAPGSARSRPASPRWGNGTRSALRGLPSRSCSPRRPAPTCGAIRP